MTLDLSRRHFLTAGMGAALIALPGLTACCESTPRGPTPPRPRARVFSSPVAAPAPPPAPVDVASCAATEANIEGPYYRAGAPFRNDLTDASIIGVPLVIGGRVLSLDCRSPLAGAVLDIWQADGAGHYDNDGSVRVPANAFRLRGKLTADAGGAFQLKTVVPGRYLNGSSYRPAHVHVKIAAPGHRPLTTQLYFPGDPYNESDPFIRRSLIMDLESGARGSAAHYDFVLIPG